MVGVSYFLVFISLFILIAVGIKKASELGDIRKNINFFFLCIVGWVIYLYLISDSGFLFDKSMPPKFPIFIFLPAFIIIGILLYFLRNSKILESIPGSWLIYYQSFRVVMK